MRSVTFEAVIFEVLLYIEKRFTFYSGSRNTLGKNLLDKVTLLWSCYSRVKRSRAVVWPSASSALGRPGGGVFCTCPFILNDTKTLFALSAFKCSVQYCVLLLLSLDDSLI